MHVAHALIYAIFYLFLAYRLCGKLPKWPNPITATSSLRHSQSVACRVIRLLGKAPPSMARGMPPLQFAKISRILDMNARPPRVGAAGRSEREEKPRLCLSNRLVRYDKAGSKKLTRGPVLFLERVSDPWQL